MEELLLSYLSGLVTFLFSVTKRHNQKKHKEGRGVVGQQPLGSFNAGGEVKKQAVMNEHTGSLCLRSLRVQPREWHCPQW